MYNFDDYLHLLEQFLINFADKTDGFKYRRLKYSLIFFYLITWFSGAFVTVFVN